MKQDDTYSIVITGEDKNGIKYERAIDTPFKVEELTAESLARLQEQAENIPGGFAGAMRKITSIAREQKPSINKEDTDSFLSQIEPYFECGMFAEMFMTKCRELELIFFINKFGASGDAWLPIYSNKKAFTKKELKKECYEGKSIEEIENDYVNAFLALPFEEQQKRLNNSGEDELCFVPGSLYERFIYAWENYALQIAEETTIKLREPEALILPIDKVTSSIFNQKNKEHAETITGSIRVESKKERAKGKELETSYIIEREDKQIALSISKKDLFFLIMIDGIYTQAVFDGVPSNRVEASPLELAKIIYRAKRPGTAYIEEIKEAVTRMRNISVKINNEQEAKEHGKDTLDDTFYLLPCEFRSGKVQILKRPVMIEEWVLPIMGQYTTIAPDILGVPSVNKTDDNCAIILELLRSIMGEFTYKNQITGEKEISISKLFVNCGIAGSTQAERNKKTRLRKNTILPCLVYWSAGNYAKNEAETTYKTYEKLKPEARIIDGFRLEKETIYIIPKAKNITSQKNKNAKK